MKKEYGLETKQVENICYIHERIGKRVRPDQPLSVAIALPRKPDECMLEGIAKEKCIIRKKKKRNRITYGGLSITITRFRKPDRT